MTYLKKTLIYFIIHTFIGLIALLVAIFGNLPEGYRESMVSGIAGGFLVSGVFGIITCLRLMKNPKKAMEAEISKTEERTQFLRMKSNSATYTISIFAESIGTLIAGLLGFREVSLALAALLIAQIIAFIGFANYYSRKY